MTADFEQLPFSQTDAYSRAIVPAETLCYFVNDTQKPQIACVGYVRKKAGLKMLVIQGECLSLQNIDRRVRQSFYEQLHHTGYDIYELHIDTPYSPADEIALRQAGWLRPVGLFSTTLSKIIDLTKKLSYSHDWSRNLKKAASYGVGFRLFDGSAEDIETFCRFYKEMLDRKHFHDIILTPSFLTTLLSDPRFVLAFALDKSGVPIAGRLVFAPQNGHAQSLFAATSVEARHCSAAYLLYDKLLQHLASTGMLTYDMGRLSPAAHKKNGLYTFKDGIGGDYVQYVGEWEWCRNKCMSVALYLMKKYIWKRVRV